MPAISTEAHERLAFLRGRLAELREAHAGVAQDYRDGQISLSDEIAQLTHLNKQVHTIVAEIVRITRPAP